MPSKRLTTFVALSLLLGLALPNFTTARNPIRSTFFSLYPGAETTQLDELPSDASHCGVCHFDFSGGGPRNPYGLGIEVGLGNGLTKEEAILAIELNDSDGDGFSNLTEITSLLFSNTPTFPGLSASNVNQISNIPSGEVTPYLTPEAALDSIPPTVSLTSPNGGEVINAETFWSVTYTASDASGISHINVYHSDDLGLTYKPVALAAPDTGTVEWFVPNLPGTQNLIRLEAVDLAGNPGSDDSDLAFTILAASGMVPTTLRDLEMSGTQPLTGVVLDDPNDCLTCHGGYNSSVEPGFNWKGSLMGNAMRDPLFFATMVIAEQDAPSAGDLCIRCHSPGGWAEGRSVDTSGGLLNEKDYEGIQCDFCHRLVDPDYTVGVDPAEDVAVLAQISPLPIVSANGQFIMDANPWRRGPRADADASHQFLESDFHRESYICATCHDVSNPVFVKVGPQDYAPDALDAPHPDMDLRNMFPVERTFSEYSMSDYANGGVYAPQFVGNKADGIAETCQDCHMRDVSGKACNEAGAPTRSDLALHTFTGANTFIPDILPDYWGDDVDAAALQAVKADAQALLQLAATLELTPIASGVSVRVINETGHKLPSGYPEGRRIWLHVEGKDSGGSTVYESGHYDFGTGYLTHDADLKLYEIHPGQSPGMAAITGLPAGPSFHFVLNDTIYLDNRIPPRGFTNANFELIQSPVVGYSYPDGQYWDDTVYPLPTNADSVTVTLYYQTTSKEYIEFLRDENTTNSAGLDLYNAWAAQGKAPPQVMAQQTIAVDVTVSTEVETMYEFGLLQAEPNPFSSSTTIAFEIPEKGSAQLVVYDVQGRVVQVLHSGITEPGVHQFSWNGKDGLGRRAAAGVYFYKVSFEDRSISKRVVLLR